MTPVAWETRQINMAPRVSAPDGSDVRILCGLPAATSALFSLAAGAVAQAVVHRTVGEVWYVVAGHGRIWRRRGEIEEITDLAPGVSLTIPVGTEFQFRNDGAGALEIFGVTIPPWPGQDEAEHRAGPWVPAL
jgi:mannose-6-phosphate isomerase-like protein (cupin superfamily)